MRLAESRIGERLKNFLDEIDKTYGLENVLVRFSNSERATFNPMSTYTTTPLGTYAYIGDFVFVKGKEGFAIRTTTYRAESRYIHFFLPDKSRFLILSEKRKLKLDLGILDLLKEIDQKYRTNFYRILSSLNSLQAYVILKPLTELTVKLEKINELFDLKEKILFRYTQEIDEDALYDLINTVEDIFGVYFEFIENKTSLDEYIQNIMKQIAKKTEMKLIEALSYIKKKIEIGNEIELDFAIDNLTLLILLYLNKFPSKEFIRKGEDISIPLTAILRKMGYDGVWDPGYGAIHINEPTQAVWWHPRAAKLIGTLENPVSFQKRVTRRISSKTYKYVLENPETFVDIYDEFLYEKYLLALQYSEKEIDRDKKQYLKHALGFKEFADYLKTKADLIKVFLQEDFRDVRSYHKLPPHLKTTLREIFNPDQLIKNKRRFRINIYLDVMFTWFKNVVEIFQEGKSR